MALPRRKPARGRGKKGSGSGYGRLTVGQVRGGQDHGGRLRDILVSLTPAWLPEAANNDDGAYAPAPDLGLLVALAWRKRPV